MPTTSSSGQKPQKTIRVHRFTPKLSNLSSSPVAPSMANNAGAFAAKFAAMRSPKELFKDCMRMCEHIGGSSQKGLNLKKAVRSEFIKNRALVDPKLIEDRKLNAFRFLTNFLLIESNKRIEQVDKSKILFNVGEREQTETEQIEKRQALKAKVLADAEEEDEAPRK